MRFIPASAAHQVPLFRTLLNAQPDLRPIRNLPEVRAHLAERFLGSATQPAERLSFTGIGQDDHATLDFGDCLDPGAQYTPEERGHAVLMHIVERLVPALQRSGADEQAAFLAAFHIVAQLGDREFATLEQSAVQGATGNRMRGEPVSATHIALQAHGEVLVHKSTRWAGYENGAGQIIGFENGGPAILRIDFVSAFWLERAQRPPQPAVPGVDAADAADAAPRIFANADGTKQFAVHGKVQRCLLETPDPELKALLTGRTTTLLDLLCYGVARLLGWAGIFIEPPAPLEARLWASTRPGLYERARHASGVVPHPPAQSLTVAQSRVQAFHPGTQERSAALALGAYCQALASRLLPHSSTKAIVDAYHAPDDSHADLLAQSGVYGFVINMMRATSRRERSTAEFCVKLVGKSLATSVGDCLEAALVSAALVQSSARQFLAERGFASADIRAELYSADYRGDHAFCVMTLKLNGFTYRVAIDAWAGVSMLYEQYVDYVTTYPDHLYTRENTVFGIDWAFSRAINQETFKRQVAVILENY